MSNYVSTLNRLQREFRATRILAEEIKYHLLNENIDINQAAILANVSTSTIEKAKCGKLNLHEMFKISFMLGVCEREIVGAFLTEKDSLLKKLLKKCKDIKRDIKVNIQAGRVIKVSRKRQMLSRRELANLSGVMLKDIVKFEWGLGGGGLKMLYITNTLNIKMNQII